MKKISQKLLIGFLSLTLIDVTHAQLSSLGSQSVRLKDMANIVEARSNQLIGYGLVVGLRNTGDSQNTGFTDASLANLLNKLGVPVGGKNFGSRNVASVMVSAALPPFAKRGQSIPVIVSALGDSLSLAGGQLLPTQLMGPDLKPYAIAQGSVIVGGISESSAQSSYQKNQTTVGRVPGGGVVEVEVPVTFEDQHNITIVLNDTNFITASRASKAIVEAGFPGAKAIDANTIKIPLADLESADLVETIAKLQDVQIIPDASSKIVINPRTGTIVIGEMVRLFPVALTHGNISVRITNEAGGNAATAEASSPLSIEETPSKLVLLNPSATLTGLVNALNEIGATPKDLISILQALKESGALIGQLELI